MAEVKPEDWIKTTYPYEWELPGTTWKISKNYVGSLYKLFRNGGAVQSLFTIPERSIEQACIIVNKEQKQKQNDNWTFYPPSQRWYYHGTTKYLRYLQYEHQWVLFSGVQKILFTRCMDIGPAKTKAEKYMKTQKQKKIANSSEDWNYDPIGETFMYKPDVSFTLCAENDYDWSLYQFETEIGTIQADSIFGVLEWASSRIKELQVPDTMLIDDQSENMTKTVEISDLPNYEPNTTGTAVRADVGKPAYHFISPVFLNELARALEYGERKYSGRNWEKGMNWSRSFGSLMRHLWAWWSGTDIDEESGLHHLALASANIMFLSHYANLDRYKDLDDRSKL